MHTVAPEGIGSRLVTAFGRVAIGSMALFVLVVLQLLSAIPYGGGEPLLTLLAWITIIATVIWALTALVKKDE